jgi:hypothetical protein
MAGERRQGEKIRERRGYQGHKADQAARNLTEADPGRLVEQAKAGQLSGAWALNLPTCSASDIVPCPAGCQERIPHHHFAPGGNWVCWCNKGTPGQKCICEEDG